MRGYKRFQQFDYTKETIIDNIVVYYKIQIYATPKCNRFYADIVDENHSIWKSTDIHPSMNGIEHEVDLYMIEVIALKDHERDLLQKLKDRKKY